MDGQTRYARHAESEQLRPARDHQQLHGEGGGRLAESCSKHARRETVGRERSAHQRVGGESEETCKYHLYRHNLHKRHISIGI